MRQRENDIDGDRKIERIRGRARERERKREREREREGERKKMRGRERNIREKETHASIDVAKRLLALLLVQLCARPSLLQTDKNREK